MTALVSLSNANIPPHLGEHGKAAWKVLTALPEGWLQRTDLELVLMYCESLDLRAQLTGIVRKEGATTTSTKGTTMIHPALREVRNVNADLLSMQRQLALTPVARLRFGLDQLAAAKHKSELDAFLDGDEDD